LADRQIETALQIVFVHQLYLLELLQRCSTVRRRLGSRLCLHQRTCLCSHQTIRWLGWNCPEASLPPRRQTEMGKQKRKWSRALRRRGARRCSHQTGCSVRQTGFLQPARLQMPAPSVRRACCQTARFRRFGCFRRTGWDQEERLQVSSTVGKTSWWALAWRRVWMLRFIVRQDRRGMLDWETYKLWCQSQRPALSCFRPAHCQSPRRTWTAWAHRR
jgi:hypothetical protein